MPLGGLGAPPTFLPENEHLMADLVRLTDSASTDEATAVIARDGGVIVEDFLSSAALEQIKADLLPQLNSRKAGEDDFSGFQTRRMSALFAKTRHLAEVVTHPLFLGPAENLINRPIGYWSGEDRFEVRPGLRIGVTQLIQIAPGETAQSLHRDHWALMWRTPHYDRHVRLQIMIAVSDFTEDNGATLVIPGSHTWEDSRIPHREEAIPAVMKAGSALLFLGSTYHAGGTNRTAGEYRTGLTMAIDAATCRQEENMYLALSPEVVKSYPEPVQRLLGWSCSPDVPMGWVEIDGKMADPLQLLA